MSYFIDLNIDEDCMNLEDLLKYGDKISLYYRVGTPKERIYRDLVFDSIHSCGNEKHCKDSFCYGLTIRSSNKSSGLCITKELSKIEILTSVINKIMEI